jgi:hypothetical protein
MLSPWLLIVEYRETERQSIYVFRRISPSIGINTVTNIMPATSEFYLYTMTGTEMNMFLVTKKDIMIVDMTIEMTAEMIVETITEVMTMATKNMMTEGIGMIAKRLA